MKMIRCLLRRWENQRKPILESINFEASWCISDYKSLIQVTIFRRPFPLNHRLQTTMFHLYAGSLQWHYCDPLQVLYLSNPEYMFLSPKKTLNNHWVSTGLCSSRTFLSKQGTTLVIFTVFPFLVLVSSLSKRHATTGPAKVGWLWRAIAGNQWDILKKLVIWYQKSSPNKFPESPGRPNKKHII